MPCAAFRHGKSAGAGNLFRMRFVLAFSLFGSFGFSGYSE
jgi:hypothetical protein